MTISTVAAIAAAHAEDSTLQTAASTFGTQPLIAILTFAFMLALFAKLPPKRLLAIIAGLISGVMVLVLGMQVSLALAPVGLPDQDLSGSGAYGEIGIIFLWIGWTLLFLPILTGVSTWAAISVRNGRRTRGN